MMKRRLQGGQQYCGKPEELYALDKLKEDGFVDAKGCVRLRAEVSSF